MTISLDESSGKGSGENEKSRFGRIIVLASIASIVGLNAFIFLLSKSIRLSEYLYWALILLICCQLYIGSIWAKWVIGLILIIFGVYDIYKLLPPNNIILNPVLIFSILLTIIFLVSGIGLISSKSVLAFLSEQFSNRNILVIRVLKALWILLLMGFLILFYQDITRIFFS